ncbi:MAG: hypothetical protein ACI85O_002330 [Saprospiraceae bacterium]|jgi:uncharacterized protein involved in exopolysaccharide biosynthesis
MVEYKDMNTNSQQPYFQDDEITLKEVILTVQKFWGEILKNWKVVAVLAGIFGALFFLKAILSPVIYSTKMTFMINEYGKSGGTGIGNVLSQFGLGAETEEYNFKKILELSRSRRIIQTAIFKKTDVDGTEDFVVNHIIKLYDFHDKWKDNEQLKEFLFKNGDFDKFLVRENRVLKIIYKKVISPDGGLFSAGYGMETGIISFSVNSINEDLSYLLVNQLYNSLSKFYTEKSVEKQLSTYNLIVGKRDSVRNELDTKQMRLLKFYDNSRSLLLSQHSAKKYALERDVQMLTQAYGEISKNAETAAFSLKNATPFFQEIDESIYPLSKEEPSILIAVILGAGLGLFLAITFIIGRMLIKKALEE